jgi:hypothetical protein
MMNGEVHLMHVCGLMKVPLLHGISKGKKTSPWAMVPLSDGPLDGLPSSRVPICTQRPMGKEGPRAPPPHTIRAHAPRMITLACKSATDPHVVWLEFVLKVWIGSNCLCWILWLLTNKSLFNQYTADIWILAISTEGLFNHISNFVISLFVGFPPEFNNGTVTHEDDLILTQEQTEMLFET